MKTLAGRSKAALTTIHSRLSTDPAPYGQRRPGHSCVHRLTRRGQTPFFSVSETPVTVLTVRPTKPDPRDACRNRGGDEIMGSDPEKSGV